MYVFLFGYPTKGARTQESGRTSGKKIHTSGKMSHTQNSNSTQSDKLLTSEVSGRYKCMLGKINLHILISTYTHNYVMQSDITGIFFSNQNVTSLKWTTEDYFINLDDFL